MEFTTPPPPRLLDGNDRIKSRYLDGRYLEEVHVRGRLREVRPSELERRGEPALPEIGSLVYGVPDADRTYRTLAERTEFALNHDWPHHWINHARHAAPVLGCHLCAPKPTRWTPLGFVFEEHVPCE